MSLVDPKYRRQIELQRRLEQQKTIPTSTTPLTISSVKIIEQAPEPTNTEQLYIEKLRRVIPLEMQTEKRWTQCFQVAKTTPGMSGKVPCSSHSDPNTWLTFDEVCHSSFKKIDEGVWVREEDAPLRPGRGIGFQFLNSEYLPIDIDHVRNRTTGEWCSEAKLLVSKLQTYTEWSVSGTGLHCIGLGKIRHKQLNTQHIQFWNGRLGVPRYFWLTGDVLGDDFTKVRDCADEFQMYASHPRIFSVKMQEELAKIDPEQAAMLPPECAAPVEEQPREKMKTKTRKVVKDFDIEDYIKFNNLKVSSRSKKEIGTCYYLTTCPFKGSEHSGQNATSTNFIYPTADGGLAFHCQSTHDEGNSIADIIKILAERNGVYPKPIYEDPKKPSVGDYNVRITTHTLKDVSAKKVEWIVEGRLARGMVVYMFAPKGRGKTKLCNHWNKLANDQGFRVLRFNMEDSEDKILKPCLHAAGYKEEFTEFADKVALATKDDKELSTSVNFSDPSCVSALRELIKEKTFNLVIIEPINNYKGKARAISEDEMRPIYQGLANLAEELNICILVISHTNKKKDVDVQEKSHGASSSVNVARINWYLDKDPNGGKEDRLLTDAGSNVPVGKSLSFKITQVPSFILDGLTFDKIAIATNFEDSEVTADEVLEDGESPARKSKANAIASWLIEFMLGKGPMDASVVMRAGHQVDKEWSEANIKQVFRRRKKLLGATSNPKGRATMWEIGNKPEQMGFDQEERVA